MAHVVALAPDLFFASKIDATLTAAGHQVRVQPGPPVEPPADVVIVDLDAPGAITAELPAGTPRLGFYSHVDVDTRQRAQEAGFELVVPRSRMAREMPALVEGLVGPSR